MASIDYVAQHIYLGYEVISVDPSEIFPTNQNTRFQVGEFRESGALPFLRKNEKWVFEPLPLRNIEEFSNSQPFYDSGYRYALSTQCFTALSVLDAACELEIRADVIILEKEDRITTREYSEILSWRSVEEFLKRDKPAVVVNPGNYL